MLSLLNQWTSFAHFILAVVPLFMLVGVCVCECIIGSLKILKLRKIVVAHDQHDL